MWWELFLRKEGCADYYEFHLTPENQRLQLHFPNEAALKSGLPLKSWMVEEDLFESFTRIHPSRPQWQVYFSRRLGFSIRHAAFPVALLDRPL